MIALTLPEPPSSNRYWRVYRGRAVLSKEALAYREAVAEVAVREGVQPIEGPIAVSLDWYRGRRAGDLDNRLKQVLDSLQGIAYENDSQVIRLTAARFDAPRNGRLEVRVEAVAA
jgi:crossover junction endodeoxyribonuclease RusA